MIAAGVGMTARHHNVTSCGRACSYLMSKCGKCAGLMFPLFRRHSTSVPAHVAGVAGVFAPCAGASAGTCWRVCFIVNLYVCRRRHLAGVFPPSKSLRVPAPAPAPVPAPCRRVPPSKSLHVPAPTPAPVPALAGVGTLPACLLLVVPAALVACVLAYMRKFPAVRPTENHVTLHRMCIIIYFL